MVELKTPDAPATDKQLWKIHELTGEDTRSLKLTMKQASDTIELLSNEKYEMEKDSIVDDTPFTETHCFIIEGDPRSGKTTYAVGKVRDAYGKSCAEIYCGEILKISCEVKAYYWNDRVVKIKHNGQIKLIQIPKSYHLHSPMRIFSNIHLFGIPYVYVPNFPTMLHWLEIEFIRDGYLIMDEAHIGISARSGMSSQGRGFVDQYFQFGKSKLDVFMITHMARLIDWTARTVPTTRVHTTYDPKTRRVHYTMKKKGEHGTKEYSFDATQYWQNYRTNEKVKS